MKGFSLVKTPIDSNRVIDDPAKLWFDILCSHSPDNLFIIEVRNGNFHLMWANKVCEQVLGQTTSQFAGKTTRKVLGKSGGARVERNYQRCLFAKAPIEYEEESTVEGKHRPRRWHTLLVPKVKDNGEIDFIYGFSREINTLSYLLFDTFSQKSPDNIFIMQVVNDNFYLHWANKTMERVGGKPLSEIRGKTVTDVLGEAGCKLEENYRQCVITKELVNYEEQSVNSGGVQYWHTQLVPIIASNGKVDFILGHARNITTLKKLQQQSIDANSAKAQLLTNVGHELGTLLNGIMGGTQLLEMQPLNDKQSQAVSLISSSAKLLQRFTKDIFDYSRLEVGKLSYHPSVFQLTDLVENLSHIMVPLAIKKDITFTKTAAHDLPNQCLFGDSDRLCQVLTNLLSNAIKYTASGGQVIFKIKVNLSATTHELTFIVIDNGPGIAPENLHKLFKPFSRIAETAHISGTGLGLAISQELVTMMNGTITVESRVGEGSQFTVVIPFPLVENTAEPMASTVLVVENHLLDARIVKEGLNALDIGVTIVASGKDALAYGLQSFDLIIMDIQLPDMDGIQVTQKLRRLGVTTPIIAYTAQATPETQQACLNAGMNEFISKPIQLRQFIGRALRWINAED
ncbi:MAG: ATP-binding protein, partial [Pseudomonadales bacterium]